MAQCPHVLYRQRLPTGWQIVGWELLLVANLTPFCIVCEESSDGEVEDCNHIFSHVLWLDLRGAHLSSGSGACWVRIGDALFIPGA
jgi:hypothetical protein